MYYYSGTFAGTDLTIGFRHPGSAGHYGNTLKKTLPSEGTILMPDTEVVAWMRQWKVRDRAYAEYVISCGYVCDRLMRSDRFVFHGATFLWRGAAYVFTAPSGTGKTTQLRLWRSLFPDEVSILNGDKPIFEITGSGRVLVHPSPWKGKEGYGRDDLVVPLGGIILLRQAPYNRIRRMGPAGAARKLFGRIYSAFQTEEEVLLAAGLIERLLEAAPVWLLENKGDAGSARLTYAALMEQEDG